MKVGRAPRSHQHPGCEFLYLLSGSLDVRHGETAHHLEPGDAVYFDANTVHSYVCSSSAPANAVIVTLQHPLMAKLPTASLTATNGRVRTRSTAILHPANGSKQVAQSA